MRKLLFIIPLLILLISCHNNDIIKYIEIPVETVKIEYIHDSKIDSIIERDSVDRYIKGDSVFIYREHTKYKYILRKDTVEKRDSVPKIIKTEITKEVEVNHIKWYQSTLMWIGGMAMVLLTGVIIYKFKF